MAVTIGFNINALQGAVGPRGPQGFPGESFDPGGLTNTQIADLRARIGIGSAELREDLAKTSGSLYEKFNEFSKQLDTQRAEFFQSSSSLYSAEQSNVLGNQSLNQSYNYQLGLLNQSLEKQLSTFQFQAEKQRITAQRQREQTNLGFARQTVQFDQQEQILAIEKERLKAQKDLLEEGLADRQGGLQHVLKAQQEILASFRRSRGLLGEQQEIAEDQVELARESATAQERALRFQSQERIGGDHAVRQFFAGERSGLAGLSDVDRASVGVNVRLTQAVNQIEATSLKRQEVIKSFAQRREGIGRSISSAKGNIGRLKAQINNLNTSRGRLKNDIKFMLQKVSAKQEGLRKTRVIAGKSRTSALGYLGNINKQLTEFRNINRDLTQKMFVLKRDNLQQSLDLGLRRNAINYNKALFDYQNSMRAQNIENQYAIQGIQADIARFDARRNRYSDTLQAAEEGDVEAQQSLAAIGGSRK